MFQPNVRMWSKSADKMTDESFCWQISDPSNNWCKHFHSTALILTVCRKDYPYMNDGFSFRFGKVFYVVRVYALCCHRWITFVRCSQQLQGVSKRPIAVNACHESTFRCFYCKQTPWMQYHSFGRHTKKSTPIAENLHLAHIVKCEILRFWFK